MYVACWSSGKYFCGQIHFSASCGWTKKYIWGGVSASRTMYVEWHHWLTWSAQENVGLLKTLQVATNSIPSVLHTVCTQSWNRNLISAISQLLRKHAWKIVTHIRWLEMIQHTRNSLSFIFGALGKYWGWAPHFFHGGWVPQVTTPSTWFHCHCCKDVGITHTSSTPHLANLFLSKNYSASLFAVVYSKEEQTPW